MRTIKQIRESIDADVDELFQRGYDLGWASLLEEIDNLSDQKHNDGDYVAAEVLRWAAKNLRGEEC
jgi:hypothetical protein